MKSINLIMGLLFIATGVNAQLIDPLSNCSCDSLAYWKAYTEALQNRNKILTDTGEYWRTKAKGCVTIDTVEYWRSRYNNEISTNRNRYKGSTSDSVWHEGKYVPRKRYEQQNFETWFMPGAGYTYYMPKANDSLGSFGGLAIEYLIYGNVEQNDNPGPSHVRFYGKLNLQNSSKEGMGQLFWYGFGFDLSIEKNPKRTFLIPYFGLEAGGISNKNMGTTGHFTPFVGLHVLSTNNLFINLHAGQVYTSKNIDLMQGYFFQGTVNFSLW